MESDARDSRLMTAFRPNPLGTIFDRNKINLHARLDNLAIELSTNKRIRGYIVTYVGKISRRGEAKEMADEARRYLIETRMIPQDRIIAIDGGYRETAQYDLFTLSLEMPPPIPTPTVPSNEVQIVRTTTRIKRRSSNRKPGSGLRSCNGKLKAGSGLRSLRFSHFHPHS